MFESGVMSTAVQESIGRFVHFIIVLVLTIGVAASGATNIVAQEKQAATDPPATNQEAVPPATNVSPEPIVAEKARQNVTDEDIAGATAELATATAMDEALRTSITQLLATATKKLDAKYQAETRIADYDKRIADAPNSITVANQQKIDIPKSPLISPADFEQLEQLRQMLAQNQAELDQEKATQNTLVDEPARRLARMAEIPGLVAKLESELSETKKQLLLEPPPNELQLQTRARRLQLGAQEMALEKEIESQKKEILYYNTTMDLLPLQVEVAQLRVAQKAKNIEALQQALVRRQETRLQRLLSDTRSELARLPQELVPFATANVEMAQTIMTYQDRANLLTTQFDETKKKHEETEKQRQISLDRFKSVGLTDALGGMLRKHRRDLLRLRQRNQPSGDSRSEIRSLQVEIFQLQDSIATRQDDEQEKKALIQQLEVGSATDAKALESAALILVARRHALMNELTSVSEQQFQKVVSLDTAKRQLVTLTTEFVGWIDERVIWIPSAPVFATGDWTIGRSASVWLVFPGNWQNVWKELRLDLTSNWFAFVPFIVAILVLFLFRGRLKKIIGETGEEARKGRCSKILPTLNSLAATFLMSALWPMIVAVLGWTLSHGPAADSFEFCVGQAFLGVAIFMAPLELLRHVCREKGLADAHFAWPDRTRKFLARNIRSFYLFSLPLMFVQGVMATQANEDWKNSLGRFVSCLLFMVVGWYLHRLFRPSGVIFQQMISLRPIPGVYRFRSLIHLVSLGMPLLLLILSLAGYYYTAYQLGGCMEQTLSLLITMMITGGVLLRWLLVRRRDLAMEEARKARLAIAAASEAGNQVGEVVAQKADKSLLDLASVSRQAREIVVLVLGSATFILMYWIWRDVLPAIGILDRAELWSVTVNEKVVQVTLKNLFNALLTGTFTWLMIRNMPGMLNLAVQKFSSLDSGARYAATTIFRYVITVIGTITALNFLMIQWSQYSWLVAAVTVGLGFGLQEIVANFVSGLILLFERPVRVGDLVTIDNVNGVVTRIQMRATTVMTCDHQELIVPNKDLVTGKLLNWTLTNVTNRLVLEVGVAYGTDVDMVRDLLEATVRSHPEILADPPLLVSFESFGDSSLNFRIRCFLPNVDRRFQIKHELNSSIARAFKKAGISIPFPQRDLHIVSGGMPAISSNGSSGISQSASISKD